MGRPDDWGALEQKKRREKAAGYFLTTVSSPRGRKPFASKEKKKSWMKEKVKRVFPD